MLLLQNSELEYDSKIILYLLESAFLLLSVVYNELFEFSNDDWDVKSPYYIASKAYE